jgi:hypothetical protein
MAPTVSIYQLRIRSIPRFEGGAELKYLTELILTKDRFTSTKADQIRFDLSGKVPSWWRFGSMTFIIPIGTDSARRLTNSISIDIQTSDEDSILPGTCCTVIDALLQERGDVVRKYCSAPFDTVDQITVNRQSILVWHWSEGEMGPWVDVECHSMCARRSPESPRTRPRLK